MRSEGTTLRVLRRDDNHATCGSCTQGPQGLAHLENDAAPRDYFRGAKRHRSQHSLDPASAAGPSPQADPRLITEAAYRAARGVEGDHGMGADGRFGFPAAPQSTFGTGQRPGDASTQGGLSTDDATVPRAGIRVRAQSVPERGLGMIPDPPSAYQRYVSGGDPPGKAIGHQSHYGGHGGGHDRIYGSVQTSHAVPGGARDPGFGGRGKIYGCQQSVGTQQVRYNLHCIAEPARLHKPVLSVLTCRTGRRTAKDIRFTATSTCLLAVWRPLVCS